MKKKSFVAQLKAVVVSPAFIKMSALALLIFGGSALLYTGFNAYRGYRTRQAQAALFASWDSFTMAREQGAADQFEAHARTLEEGANEYASTPVAPYFCLARAQVALEQKDQVTAVAFFDKAVATLPSTSPYYYVTAISAAALKLESADEGLRTQALQDLERLAADLKNPQRDYAAYLRMVVLQEQGNLTEAKVAGQELVAQGESLWAQLAQLSF